MIICPNCNHQNPEGSVQCESCYTPLPSTSPCPNCGALVQTDATFCGQCGFNLQGSEINVSQPANNLFEDNSRGDSLEEDLVLTHTETFQSPWDIEEEEELTAIEGQSLSFNEAEITQPPVSPFEETEELFEETEELEELEDLEELSASIEETDDLESWISSIKEESSQEDNIDLESEISELPELAVPDLETPDLSTVSELETPELSMPDLETPELSTVSELETPELSDVSEFETAEGPSLGSFIPESSFIEEEELETKAQFAAVETSTKTNAMAGESPANLDTATRLQLQRAVLFHTQTGTNIELPLNLAVVHIGKPNSQVPPDVDVSGFPNSEIVSRTHADIRVEGDTYFIEDRGSSNGTYINHSPLLTGNRHRLRIGDRISLGKGDLMTFIFQIS